MCIVQLNVPFTSQDLSFRQHNIQAYACYITYLNPFLLGL